MGGADDNRAERSGLEVLVSLMAVSFDSKLVNQ